MCYVVPVMLAPNASTAVEAYQSTEPGRPARRRPVFAEHWVLPEGPVPESAWHERTIKRVQAVLDYRLSSTGRSAVVYRNLAVQLRKDNERVGFDPDLCLVEPPPPDADELGSLQVWRPGHVAPALVIEVVSPRNPEKDYVTIPEKCDAMGVHELLVFDPKLLGPDKEAPGPQRLQLWRSLPEGFVRVACGDGPVESEVLGGYFVATGQKLRIAGGAHGQPLWPTAEEAAEAAREQERLQKEAAVQAKEAAVQAKEEALERVAQLEAALHKRRP